MSKNFNRKELKDCVTNKEYKIKLLKNIFYYCPICSKRNGMLYYSCNVYSRVKGRHGSGKPIFNHDYREYKNWKYNRKTQFK